MNQKDPGDVMCRWQMCDSECVRAAGGVAQKAPDFRECSPSVEPSAPADSQRSPVSGGRGDAGSGDSMPNDGTVEQKLRPIVFAL